MAGPLGHYAKWNKSDRERQILYDFTYMWNLKTKTNEQTKQNRNRLTDIGNKLMITRAGRGWGAGKIGEWD